MEKERLRKVNTRLLKGFELFAQSWSNFSGGVRLFDAGVANDLPSRLMNGRSLDGFRRSLSAFNFQLLTFDYP
ncbi:MAG: hypothetical protein DMG27_11095 [Acidobacteria bacterium]|nr:MAG: hypothetical protein DMG27_11095 [Acidobacteriota bacterium]